MNPSIIAVIDIAYDLIKSGLGIFSVLKDKGTLSEQDLKDIIALQNKAQDEARAKLQALLDT